MLVHNKYLEELGVGENDYPLGNSCNHETELDEEAGVVPCQTWNLNLTLAMEIYTYIRAFRDNTHGHPACLESMEEWDKILDEMMEGFADYIKRRDEVTFHPDNSKLERSLDLLKEWWEALWW